MGENYGMPWDAIAFYAVSLIIFLYSLIATTFSLDYKNLMVAVTYALSGVMAIVIGWAMVRALERREE